MSNIRQGDLTFIRRDDMIAPETTTPVRVLALGESSGHCHECEDAIGEWFVEGDRFLLVERETRVVISPPAQRDRHAAVTLAPGVYQVPGMPDDHSKWLGQRQYTPEAVVGAAD